MTDQQPPATDVGSRCVCGHAEHVGRCSCGCRSYVCAGTHADQSRAGAVPAAVALVLCAVLLVAITVILVRAL